MPLGSSRSNSRLSTPSTSTSTSASASGSSPSLSAVAVPADGVTTTITTTAATPTTARPAQSVTPLPTTTTTTTTTSRPGFLSRLSRPLNLSLRGRPRSINDFHILCDEPHRKYNAGDPVRGAVVLVVIKPLRLTHLVVTLHGFVRVLKDAAAVTKTTLPPGGSSSRPQYHGNGFASLFQDEQVLCGEGRLEPGKYEFKFDLLFPDKGLPSSIDFERGTISYMITATLTKPTPIAPTVSCDRKITLAERINVGLLSPPRPRAIFLEPISKRTRRKKPSMALEKGAVVVAQPEISDPASETGSLDHSVSFSESTRDSQPPSEQRGAVQCDVQSEVSGESARSISAALSPGDPSQLSQAGTTLKSAHQQEVDDKTITATIELLKGGCLPGDTVSVRVNVQHVKRVKSMTGVVVTLFRQGKIDYAPSPSLFSGTISMEDARRMQVHEMYPRSRTGLSGLSLSSAGSVSMFRKDLYQTTAPLILDPVTLQASITVPIKVPYDLFPTIKGVPGDMISFKYQVEVIIDLGGKLSGQLQGGQTSNAGLFSSSASDQSLNLFSSRRDANIVETSQLKRKKGVISVSIESVVGTVDSSLGRRQSERSQPSGTLNVAEGEGEGDGGGQGQGQPTTESHESQPQPSRLSPPRISSPDYYHGPAPLYIAPPQMPDQRNMSEKEHIRQAELRLLPSQPPDAAAGPAPDDDDDIYDAHVPSRHDAGGPSAPTEEEVTATCTPVEDKQELERRRLMEEASVPPEVPEDMGGGSAGEASAEPTAPILNDDDEENYHGNDANYPEYGSGDRGEGHGEQLPAYQR